MKTNQVIPHIYMDEYRSNGRKSARAFIKRKCRRAVRREVNRLDLAE